MVYINLNPNANITIDGVPPGEAAVDFNSSKMWNAVDQYMEQNKDGMGLADVHNQLAKSFVFGLGIQNDPRSIEILSPQVKDIKLELSGNISPVIDDKLGQTTVSPASIGGAAQAQQDLGIKQ